MKHEIYYIALLVILLFTRCYRDDLCFDHPHDARIELQIDWSRAKLAPNAATALIYKNGALFQTELITVYPPVRKIIELPVGNYSIVVHNELAYHLSSTLGFRDKHNWESFYVHTIDDPDANRYYVRAPFSRALQMEVDTLAADRKMDFEVTEEMINNQHVHPTPIGQAGQSNQKTTVLRFFPERVFTLCDIVLKVKNARGYFFSKTKLPLLVGTAQGYYPGTDTYSAETVEHNLKFTSLPNLVDDNVTVMMASRQVIGLYEYHQQPPADLRSYVLHLPFTNSGGIAYRDILLPSEATRFVYTPKEISIAGRAYDHLYIEVFVELPPLVEVGGLDADVEDWIDVDVPLDGPSFVSFIANNGTKDSFRWPNTLGATINLPQPLFLAQPGYTFKEWNTDPDGYGASFVPGQEFEMRRGGTIFYAIWSKADWPAITLTFHANNGTGDIIASQQKPGTTITLPERLFTAPSNKMFKEWNSAADGSGTSFLPNSTLTVPINNLNFYAIYYY